MSVPTRPAARTAVLALSVAAAMVGGLQVATPRSADAHVPLYCDDEYFRYWDSSCPPASDDPDYDPTQDPNSPVYDPFGTPPFIDPNFPRPPVTPPPPPPTEPVVVFPPDRYALPLPFERIRLPLGEHHDGRDGSSAIDFGRGPDGTQLPNGTPVYAVEGGTVTVFDSVTCGMGVQIDNGTHQWRYCHLSSRNVASGNLIAAGGEIGGSGNTGFDSEGNQVDPHLHLQVRTRVGGVNGPLRCPHRIVEALMTGGRPPRVEALPTFPCVPPPAPTPRPPGINPGHQIP